MLNAGPPVEPRPASSVLVVDHRADPWTLLMMRRPDGADFAPCWPVLRKYLGEARPAATMIVAGLYDPRMRIEVEVTARRRS